MGRECRSDHKPCPPFVTCATIVLRNNLSPYRNMMVPQSLDPGGSPGQRGRFVRASVRLFMRMCLCNLCEFMSDIILS